MRMAVMEWGYKYPLIVAATAGDARDIMIEGESGLLSVFPQNQKPIYEPSKRRVIFPNGVIGTIRSAEEPERFRGVQSDFVACDELAAWNYPQLVWDMIEFGHRLGPKPIALITTTPKPLKIIKDFVEDPNNIITTGSTYENKANLSPKFIERIKEKYEGTRLGRQELYGEILKDVEGSLWSYDIIKHANDNTPDNLKRIVVAIDPAVTTKKGSDETGIVVAGLGQDGLYYVMDDFSGHHTPEGWARVAIDAYHDYKADRIIGEVNNGGDMIKTIIKNIDPHVSYKDVRASRGKVTRAEPIAALYEQGKVIHCKKLQKLEDQMCEFTIDFDRNKMGYSPDRIDALVWAITDLMSNKGSLRISII